MYNFLFLCNLKQVGQSSDVIHTKVRLQQLKLSEKNWF